MANESRRSRRDRDCTQMAINDGNIASVSNKAVEKDLRAGEWPVYPHYKAVEADGEIYICAPQYWVGEDDSKELELFSDLKAGYQEQGYNQDLASRLAANEVGIDISNTPLRYKPLWFGDLFLEFANLIEEGPITPEVVLDWAESHGVLGLQKIDGVGTGQSNPRGGPGESVARFRERAQEANSVLRLYEAAVSPTGPDVDFIRERIIDPQALSEMALTVAQSREVGVRTNPQGQQMMQVGRDETTREERDALVKRSMRRRSSEKLEQLALDYIAQVVHMRVTADCYPHLYKRKDNTFEYGWGFKSLLGAMWLQMMWLMAAPEGGIRQCRWCHKIITYKGPKLPKGDSELKNDRSHGYRTRNDKKFCNDRCRAQYHYYYHAKYR